jgi:hypothetical protein
VGLTRRNYDHLTWKLASPYEAQTIRYGHDAVSEAGIDGKEMLNARALGLSVLQFRAFWKR